MSWSPGTRLGPYEILAPLGAGGMGEVHRARDTRLNRDVAIKAIPASLVGQELIRQRFEREARLISSLNHPNICTLYDVGHASGEGAGDLDGREQLHYLVMELLEGESLADRLLKGPLPFHEVLKYGRQIASALDAAHRQGIIHRDLKPGNVMLTRTGAKLLDFGLARTAAGEPPPISLGSAGSRGSEMATMMVPEPRPLTAQGTIVGTFQYMAPEQLEGLEADARTDIFALGAVLYEMSTGQRAFQGSTRTSLIAAIVSTHPAPISSVTQMAPPALDHVVQRCLEKDPDDRWQSAQDVAVELQWISESGSQAGLQAPVTMRRATREKLAWGLAAALAVTSLVLAVGRLPGPAPTTRPAFRATLTPPPDSALIPFDLMGLSLSPDGGTLAFVAATTDGRKQIWLRHLSDMTARPLPETESAAYPFWSPDGQSLGFFADSKLKTIDLRGGSPRVLADAPTGRGGSWGSDGVILFAPNITSPILRIPAAGGQTEPATRYDPGSEATHRWPVFLPDGRHFIYLARVRTTQREVGRLMLASLGAPEPTVLIEDSTNALYAAPGYIIYGRSANLFAWRFDAASLRLSGQAVPIVKDKVSYWEPKNYVPFAVSGEGTLVYLPDSNRPTEIRWYDRQGRPLGPLGAPGHDAGPRISPDGRKIAYTHSETTQSLVDVWVRDLDLNRAWRLTQESGLYMTPTWAPDSDRLAFLCQPKGVEDICGASVTGGGETRVLYESNAPWKTPGSWMPDGKRMLIVAQDPKTDMDILMLPGDGGQPTDVLRTPFTEKEAQVSPDGRRMAFVSNQSGRYELYIRNLEGPPGQWQVSTEGAEQPRWRADGREILYAALDGYLMSAPIPAGSVFRPETPVRLFSMPERPEYFNPIFEDMTPDGQRILLNVPTTSRTTIGFHAISNWTALLGADGR